MIAYLKGVLTYKSPTRIYIECFGVGYSVHISLQTYSKIEHLEEAKIYIHTHLTEQAHTLYGFADEPERDIFLHLISVNGVGPATARLVLSSLSADELRQAIIQQDVSLIKKVKGIGPKTAQRLILELRDKMNKEFTEDLTTPNISGGFKNTVKEEAIAALAMLGFPKNHAERVVQSVIQESSEAINTEELIKRSLKKL